MLLILNKKISMNLGKQRKLTEQNARKISQNWEGLNEKFVINQLARSLTRNHLKNLDIVTAMNEFCTKVKPKHSDI